MNESITVRKMQFEFSDDMELVFIEHDPELSFLFLGTWMLLPYLEPYLMRTMRKALTEHQDALGDSNLVHDMQQFCSQEGQHYQQHAKANEIILSKMPEPSRQKMMSLLEKIEAEYKSFSAEQPLVWNLAYAEGFEAYTAAGARTQMELRVFDYMANPIRDLMLWHIMEELEHRTVAFDAYEALGRGYQYRLRNGIWAQKHFVGLGRELTAIMLEAFPELVAAHQDAESKQVRERHRKVYYRRAMKNLIGIYMPWYSPRKLNMPPMYEEAREEYDNRALSTAG